MRVAKNTVGILAFSLACAAGWWTEKRPGSSGHDAEISELMASEPSETIEESNQRLTRNQVEMYIAVRKRTNAALDGRDASGVSEAIVHLPARQSAAIEELGYEPAEFLRVAAIIDEVRAPAETSRFDEVEVLRALAVSSRTGVADEPATPQAHHDLTRIDEESRAHNVGLLTRYSEELAALDWNLSAPALGN